MTDLIEHKKLDTFVSSFFLCLTDLRDNLFF